MIIRIIITSILFIFYVKKNHVSAIALFQMLKIQELSLDNREKFLDLLCFPDLYPFNVMDNMNLDKLNSMITNLLKFV